MNQKGQGALEYLLLIGGAILIAAVVLSIASGLAGQGQGAADARLVDSLCASIPKLMCGCTSTHPLDPDGDGSLGPNHCVWDSSCRSNVGEDTTAGQIPLDDPANGACP